MSSFDRIKTLVLIIVIAVAGTGIKDLVGNKLAAASVINFTTAA